MIIASVMMTLCFAVCIKNLPYMMIIALCIDLLAKRSSKMGPMAPFLCTWHLKLVQMQLQMKAKRNT